MRGHVIGGGRYVDVVAFGTSAAEDPEEAARAAVAKEWSRVAGGTQHGVLPREKATRRRRRRRQESPPAGAIHGCPVRVRASVLPIESNPLVAARVSACPPPIRPVLPRVLKPSRQVGKQDVHRTPPPLRSKTWRVKASTTTMQACSATRASGRCTVHWSRSDGGGLLSIACAPCRASAQASM